MADKTALVWFRQDLRLRDNPALIRAASEGYSIIPVFILDDINAGAWKHGGASRWWLHQSLTVLNKSLSGKMIFAKGDARIVISDLIQKTDAKAVFWNRCYEPWRIARDKKIKDALQDAGVEAESFNANMLWEPWQVLKDDKTPYKVFTPYYRRGCLSKPEPAAPAPAPKDIRFADVKAGVALDDLGLMPRIKWYAEMAKEWMPGEAGAQKRLKVFTEDGLRGYKEGRNYPDRAKISRLSPHLHFGEISPREAWHTVRAAGFSQRLESDMDCFCSEMGWREFSTYLLYHFSQLPTQPLQKKFTAFEWDTDDEALRRWQQGQTGVPIVDAGMRQLWRTGYMHNRVRMIVASYLVKNLRLHWHHGQEWFWDCLLDADLANNAASWQWVAGCGADAAPYFRIFNPVTQGEKFDPDGKYVQEFVPELRDMPLKYIHRPWDSPNPPTDYPEPMVDLKKSREDALEAFANIKNSA